MRGDGIKETLWTSGFGGVVYAGYLHKLNCRDEKWGIYPIPSSLKQVGGGVGTIAQIKMPGESQAQKKKKPRLSAGGWSPSGDQRSGNKDAACRVTFVTRRGEHTVLTPIRIVPQGEPCGAQVVFHRAGIIQMPTRPPVVGVKPVDGYDVTAASDGGLFDHHWVF